MNIKKAWLAMVPLLKVILFVTMPLWFLPVIILVTLYEETPSVWRQFSRDVDELIGKSSEEGDGRS